MIIYDNNNYKIVVPDHQANYQIVNKVSGVCEGVEQVLPKAVVCADTWSEAIDRHKQKSKESANVVDIGTTRQDRT